VEPPAGNTRVGIPTPVADEDVVDEDVVIPTRQEMAAMTGTPNLEGGGSSMEIIFETEDVIPSPTDFQPIDNNVEMIFSVTPVYPRLAKLSGMEGVVSIQAYVGIEGNVIKAQVGISSGFELLDEAAVEAAYKNKFKPAVWNGQPVAVWVTYQVRFKLE
jgi:TonB family protein